MKAKHDLRRLDKIYEEGKNSYELLIKMLHFCNKQNKYLRAKFYYEFDYRNSIQMRWPHGKIKTRMSLCGLS